MPWTFCIDLMPESKTIDATLSPVISDPAKLINALLKTDMLREIRERWEQRNADHLIRAIEADPRQNGYHYTKLFDAWFQDWLLKHHMPEKGKDYIIDDKLCARWIDCLEGVVQ